MVKDIDIKGYEGLYKVDNHGVVRSLTRTVIRSNGRPITYEGKVISPAYNKYAYVFLWKDGKSKKHWIHRLVAEAFLDNPDNLPFVNHKDENPTNNFVWVNPDGTVDPEKSNLEWCDATYNNSYGTRPERIRERMTNRKDKSKPVNQYTLDGQLVNTFPSASEVQRRLGYLQTAISKCCRGDFRTMYGYRWEYV